MSHAHHHHSAREALKDGTLSSLLRNRTHGTHHQHNVAKAVVRHEVALPNSNALGGIVFHGFFFTLVVVVAVVGTAVLLHFLSKSSLVDNTVSSISKRISRLFGRKQTGILRRKTRSSVVSQALAGHKLNHSNSHASGGGSGGNQSNSGAGRSFEMVSISDSALLSNALEVKSILTRTDVATVSPYLPARFVRANRACTPCVQSAGYFIRMDVCVLCGGYRERLRLSCAVSTIRCMA